jgi:putative ABC transport system permease protein
MRELMREVLTSFMSNKMRTILTGLAMGWGVFILIVLISSGNGIVNGMHYNFRAYNIGMVTLTPRETSLSFGGKERGWPVYFFEEDCDLLKKRFGDTIAQTIPVISRPVRAHREKYYTNTIIDGYRPGYAPAPNVQLAEGRDINDLDLQQMRKVCLIPKRLKPVLFPEDTTSVIGRNLIIDDVVFEVIGIYEPLMKENKTSNVVAPLTTVKHIFCPDGKLSKICLQTQHLTTSELNVAFNASVVGVLAAQKGFSPSDRRAVKVDNLYDLPMLLNSIISGLYAFVIIVGLATLLTGIVGISNIMLIAVKERTRELGIRRALGAKNRQIVTMVMTESVVISVIFGYVGMIMGIGLMELMAWIVASTGNAHIFYNPTIAVSHALVVMFLMVIVGLIAGYMPAKHAVGMKLTEALSAV